jgi:tetratricopeptide (TPR) repeat protein
LWIWGQKKMTWNERNGISPHSEYLYQKAREKADSGEYEHAIEMLHEAVTHSPKNYHALCELGNCHDYMSRYDDAVSYYDKVITLDPYNADAWFNKGMSLKKMGREKEAAACIERSIDLYFGRS